jgi:hypothetical protein
LNRGASGFTQNREADRLGAVPCRPIRGRSRIASGKPRGPCDARIDPGERKLAVPAANQQRGLGVILGSQQSNDFRLHDP